MKDDGTPEAQNDLDMKISWGTIPSGEMKLDEGFIRICAAVHLCVPDSGVDWLDEMIRRSLYEGFARQAMPLAKADAWMDVAEQAYEAADAMMDARIGALGTAGLAKEERLAQREQLGIGDIAPEMPVDKPAEPGHNPSMT